MFIHASTTYAGSEESLMIFDQECDVFWVIYNRFICWCYDQRIG